MGMGFEVLEVIFDLRHTVKCGEDFPIGFRLALSAAIAGHGGRFWTEVLSCWSSNALGFQRLAGYAFQESSFSQSPIATHLPHLSDSHDFDRAEFSIIETTNLRF